MPATLVDSHGIEAVANASILLKELLERADSVKQTSSIEPPLVESDFDNLQSRLNDVYGSQAANVEDLSETQRTQRFAIIETAVRDTFRSLIATIPIESPHFVKVWNLFDILSILSDNELCDPALMCWLVEELLDSQTIAGCRKVFDFLESRRERIRAKHFKQKRLVMLRMCNELLRRMSRASEAAFCGKISIFMSQTFFGDKSSVNLRGEYHVENVTIFDRDAVKADGEADKMDVDMDATTPSDKPSERSNDRRGDKQDRSRKSKANAVEVKKKPLDPEALYPIFWSLQESFNQPKRLFEPSQFASFKSGLEATMTTFCYIQQSRTKEKQERPVEEARQALKRKRSDGEDALTSGFNPKYLTSPDLFKLEISDLAFRRNILIQALIVMDFLLSLSPKAKEKLATITNPNKSVIYAEYKLSEEDFTWVTKMKEDIKAYLKTGPEGPHFCRLVETVLSRDKNWVRWKIENCPSIELPSLDPEIFVAARASAAKLATTKRLRPTPMGSLSLDFLDQDDEAKNLEKLKDCQRYRIPALDSFKRGIAEDELEIDMPANNESKNAAIEGKASKSWRALRIASKSKLVAFDKIEDDDKIDVVFEDLPAEDADEPEEEELTNGETRPLDDRRPIIIVDSTASSFAKDLITQHPRTFTKVAVHVTRAPAEGEVNGHDYHFVNTQAFNMMRDSDHFLEFSDEGDDIHGTSRKVVDAITDNDRVAVMEMNYEGAQQVKDNGFDARFVFIQPPAAEAFEVQLKERNLTEEQIQQAIKSAEEAAEKVQSAGFYDALISAEYRALESFVFGAETNGAEEAESSQTHRGETRVNGEGDGDVAMEDATAS
ncbi:THO complex subunit 1 transcription elongation factor-domain-containing protein [Podospora australis]|uniref:THO complex subunit 1 transcription elongation factor-domain-containing protein n=1 Tax=Podospora australis TaxID=1536484 RepID=A0AAN6X4N7_9PEZI|nr:THO complex subunit 1 transcription elongation factor-domain-containing protein [Podospora australis]